MTYRVTNRGIAAGAATALAIGTLTIFGTSVANAAPVVRDWADGKTSFNRTISNGTPGVGETITVTTKFRRTDNITETINWITDVNPPCLTYVPGSAKVNGSPVTPVVNPNRGGTPPSGIVTVNGLTLVNAPGTNNPSYSVDYKVGANCALGGALQTGMDYSGDRGAGYYGFGGPNITAGKGNPATTLAPVTGARVGQSTSLSASVIGGGSAAGNPVEFYDGATKIGQGNLDAAGAVSFAWTPTTAGGHALTAKFLATATANQSVSAVQNVAVTPADVTTTTSVTGPATAVAGTDVTLGVQVSPVPSGGTVQFKDGATNIGGPVTLDAQGKGSITQQFASAGAHSITAVYSGAGEFQASTSGAHSVAVSPANVATETTVTGDTTGVVGTDVALTAHVSPAPAVGGKVQFKNGTTDLGGPVDLDAQGNASIAVPLAAGNHAITAVFAGFNEHQGSTSVAHTVAVSPANVATETTVTGDITGVVGTDVALTAHVSPAPAVGGKVQFKNGTTDLGGPVDLDAQGNASIAVPLAAGNHAITAVFAGFNEHQGSTSAAHTVAVAPADVATTTVVSGPASAVAGADVTLSVQVSPAPAGGTVQFKDGATDLGGPVNLDNEGKASITQQFATAGARSITAVYSGAGEFQPSTSGAHNVNVTPADVATTTSVTGPATAVAGADVTLGVQVSPVPSGGTVQFKDGATDLGGPVNLDNEGKASITQQFASAGARSITAVYSGAGEFQPSTSGAHNVNVTPADVATTTSVTGPATAVAGADVTLGVQVSPVPSGGTVQFKDGATDLGGPVNLDNEGKASITQQFASAGARSITAVYSGAGEFQPSTSGAHNVNVTPANVATETTVTGDTNGVVGTDVALTAHVSPAPAVGGKVQFKNGTTDLGGPVDLDAQGNASIAVPLAAGNHAITAVFAGFNEHQGSTSAVHTVAVSPADVATTTSVTGPATAVEGADVVLNVQVSPVPAGGTVQFKNGANNIGGPVTLDSEGKGSITQQFATTGAQSITAVYSGAAGFITSTSEAHTVTVSAPAETDVATSTVLTVPATATKGVAVNLIATVSPTPTGGTVQFMDGTTPLGAPIGLMNSKATRSQVFTTTGAHEITAIYSGAPGFLTSTAEVATVTVDEPGDGGNGAGGSLGNLFGSS